jgi:hypothetical protein
MRTRTKALLWPPRNFDRSPCGRIKFGPVRGRRTEIPDSRFHQVLNTIWNLEPWNLESGS